MENEYSYYTSTSVVTYTSGYYWSTISTGSGYTDIKTDGIEAVKKEEVIVIGSYCPNSFLDIIEDREI